MQTNLFSFMKMNPCEKLNWCISNHNLKKELLKGANTIEKLHFKAKQQIQIPFILKLEAYAGGASGLHSPENVEICLLLKAMCLPPQNPP